ncbi:hypothetical protein [Algoriphagus halophilus]|nr:hypothetical protein [Algoriphagus halophilus]
MNKLFQKSFTIPFYKANMGFFILTTLVFGVFMEMRQHLMIAEKILERTAWFASFLCLWILFSAFQFSFYSKLIQRPNYWIFSKLAFLSFPKYCKRLIPVWISNHLFPLFYALIVLYQGIFLRFWERSILLLTFIFLIGFVHLYLGFIEIKKFKIVSGVSGKKVKRKRPFIVWFYFHLQEERPLLLLLSKLFSLFVLNGFFYTYYQGGYDERWLLFGMLITSFIHFPLWLDKSEFTHRKLSIFNNLPFSLGFKLKNELRTTCIFILPEIGLMLFQGLETWGLWRCLIWAIYWIGLNLGLISMCRLKFQTSRFQLLPIWSFFGAFLAIIYSTPALLFALIPFAFFLHQIRRPYLN